MSVVAWGTAPSSEIRQNLWSSTDSSPSPGGNSTSHKSVWPLRNRSMDVAPVTAGVAIEL
jgi:hypothetical protein